MSDRKKLKIPRANNTTVYINEDLTRRRSYLFSLGRKAYRSKDLHSSWTFDGRIYFREFLKDGKGSDPIRINQKSDIPGYKIGDPDNAHESLDVN
ncbi:hypothetical protein SNE40_002891 [Patella caerulea]|uniref:Uncharacterized protein n=1 Tax=Patella caerulea TaxID=87958 RepID=A0AAN8QEM0_PATCE